MRGAVVAIGCSLWACERDAVTPHASAMAPVAPVSKTAPPALAPAPPPSPPPSPVTLQPPVTPHAKDLFDHADWIGQELTIDLFEPMLDSDHSSGAQPGEYDVEVTDVDARRLVLAPGTLKQLPGLLHPPTRVRGTLEATAHGLRIRVAELTPQSFPVPVRFASVAELLKDPARGSGRYVQVEDTWAVGFEFSYLGGLGATMWLDGYDGMKVVCEPKRSGRSRSGRRGLADLKTYHVRVTGLAYTAGGYGHMGLAQALMVASELVYLDPSRPECK